MNSYLVIGVYADSITWDDAPGRFAHTVEATDPEAAERAAMLWADSDIIIAGTVEVWNPRGFDTPEDLAKVCEYDPEDEGSVDALIEYKDALEDELRSAIETATTPPRVH